MRRAKIQNGFISRTNLAPKIWRINLASDVTEQQSKIRTGRLERDGIYEPKAEKHKEIVQQLYSLRPSNTHLYSSGKTKTEAQVETINLDA